MPSSRRGRAWALAGGFSGARALRRWGLAIRSRATASAGKSRSSLPPARVSTGDLLEDYEDVAFADGLSLFAADLFHRAVILGLDRDLHLHRLEDDDGVALLDRVPDGDLEFPARAGDMSLA